MDCKELIEANKRIEQLLADREFWMAKCDEVLKKLSTCSIVPKPSVLSVEYISSKDAYDKLFGEWIGLTDVLASITAERDEAVQARDHFANMYRIKTNEIAAVKAEHADLWVKLRSAEDTRDLALKQADESLAGAMLVKKELAKVNRSGQYLKVDDDSMALARLKQHAKNIDMQVSMWYDPRNDEWSVRQFPIKDRSANLPIIRCKSKSLSTAVDGLLAKVTKVTSQWSKFVCKYSDNRYSFKHLLMKLNGDDWSLYKCNEAFWLLYNLFIGPNALKEPLCDHTINRILTNYVSIRLKDDPHYTVTISGRYGEYYVTVDDVIVTDGVKHVAILKALYTKMERDFLQGV